MITSWKGKNIEDCSREELLECIRCISPIYQEHFEQSNIRARALDQVEMWKRGEKTA